MYFCEICNYCTEVRTAMYKHNRSSKHIQNVNKLKEKEELEIIKTKDKEIEELKQKLIESENQKKEFESQKKELEIQKKEFEIKAQIYKELSEKSKNVNNGTITNNINYVIKNYNKAPPLQKITDFVINGIDMDDDNQRDKIIENIMYYYKNKSLHKLIGDHIVKTYKKDNQKLQSFHTTDVARCNYLVKLKEDLGYIYDESSDEIDNYDPEEENNSEDSDSSSSFDDADENKKTMNKSSWKKDNGGKKVSYLLFEPIIKKMVRQLKKQCRDYNKDLLKNKKTIPTKEDMEKFELLSNIIKDIDADKIKKNVNKYIAPYFDLEKKPRKIKN